MRPARIGSILPRIIESKGLKAAFSRHRVIKLWPEIVSPAVASHAVAEKVIGSVLHVVVDSSVWANELAAVKHVLLEKVNATLDAQAAQITDIRFRQGSWVARRAGEPSQPEPPPDLSEQESEMVEAAVKRITDEELRSVLRRILTEDMRLKHGRGEKK